MGVGSSRPPNCNMPGKAGNTCIRTYDTTVPGAIIGTLARGISQNPGQQAQQTYGQNSQVGPAPVYSSSDAAAPAAAAAPVVTNIVPSSTNSSMVKQAGGSKRKNKRNTKKYNKKNLKSKSRRNNRK